MDSTEKIATNKLVLLLVFLSTAIMSSLFVYRSAHRHDQPLTTTANSIMFAAPRTIKSFNLVSMNAQPFTQNDLHDHWTLMVFGFTHCSTICPTNLALLSNAYETLRRKYPNLQVIMVSLDPQRDSVTSLKQYVQHFHHDFIGVSGKINELRKLQSQLGIFAGVDPSSSSRNYQLQHTASILLINPHGEWVGQFSYGIKTEELAMVFDKTVPACS